MYKDSKPKNNGARPNSSGYPVHQEDNRRAVESIDGLRVKSQEPKMGLAKPGRTNYAIPSATRERAMNERLAKEDKPRESRFTEDMEA